MAINPISAIPQSGIVSAAKGLADKTKTTEAAKEPTQAVTEEAAVFEKSEQQPKKLTYTRDTTTLSEISRLAEERFASLRNLVENLFAMQRIKKGESKGLSYDEILEKYDGNLKSFYENLEVDDATRLQAQQDISENGYYGVKQGSQRLIQFAIGLSGGDPSKLAVLKDAIEKGYKEAEEAWGGELPEICKQTKEAALKGLDDWANSLA